MTQPILQGQAMSLQLTINLDFLQLLQPPSSFPPNQQELTAQIENKFLAECQRFIANERTLFKCSKSIQTRLKSIIRNAESIVQSLSSSHSKLTTIAHELAKHKEHDALLRQRQKMLNLLCELIKMEELRKDLLLDDKPPSQKGTLDNQGLPNQKGTLINEDDYLGKLQRLDRTMEESGQVGQEFGVVREIVGELQSIFELAIQQIVKRYMTPRMVELALSKYSRLFFREEREGRQSKGGRGGRGKSGSEGRVLFARALVGNRIQSMKVSLNPMINNLNYASNIPELYESVLSTWARLLRQERALFSSCDQPALLQRVNRELVAQLLPKMEKNIFRIKELVAVVRIRKYFYDFWNELRDGAQEQHGAQQALLDVLMKCQAVIDSQLNEEAAALENSKYNIYTLASYIPIREHLQRIKLCYQFSLQNEQVEWQRGLEQLWASRDPAKHPTNKSLLIFNLNVWYLYLKILPLGKHARRAEQLMAKCFQAFASINLQETNKKYYQAFEKLLEIGGNLPAFKSTLYAELNLLGHQQLRSSLAHKIQQAYLAYYETLLEKLQKQPMSNEEVKAYCAAKKINLNKFGKHSHSICIHSPETLRHHLSYH